MGDVAREYQSRAVGSVFTEWETHRRVVLVCPTGGGKTKMGEDIILDFLGRNPGAKIIWIAHRRELIKQAAERLKKTFGELQVGMILPGVPPSPYAPIQVASVQTLIAREGQRPPADLLVFDEAHHVMADSYKAIVDSYQDAYHLGLTATPERATGEPLGDMYESLVVAAQYSELLQGGFLVPMRVFQPPDIPGQGLALEPLEAYKRYANGSQCFAFFTSVKEAKAAAEAFATAGIPAAYVEATTKGRDRHERLEAFRCGKVKVLCNVYVFTEGTDVPSAETILLARQCAHVSTYLQIAGRALRPSPGKEQAKLIDLTGASLIHGLPLEDRIYSLDGNGIKRTSETPLKMCLKCGATILSAYRVCPNCGYNFPIDPRKDPKIYDWALTEVYAGAATPVDAKQREWERLRRFAKAKGWGVGFAIREYRKLKMGEPPIETITELERADEMKRLVAIGKARNFKPGFPLRLYRELFLQWPPRYMWPEGYVPARKRKAS